MVDWKLEHPTHIGQNRLRILEPRSVLLQRVELVQELDLVPVTGGPGLGGSQHMKKAESVKVLPYLPQTGLFFCFILKSRYVLPELIISKC